MGKASRRKQERRQDWPLERLLPLRQYKYLRDRIAGAKARGEQVILNSVAADPRKW